MAQHLTKWSLPQFIITVIMGALLFKGADYLLKSGNGDTLVIASGMLITVGYSDLITVLLRLCKKEKSEKKRAEPQNQS